MLLKCLAAVVGAAAVAFVCGCASTTVATEWKSPASAPPRPFMTVVTLVLNATPGQRRAAEDELARQMTNARGVPAYTFLPDEDVKDRAKLKADLDRIGADGLVVLRLVDKDKSTGYYERGDGPDELKATFSMFSTDDVYSTGYSYTTVTIRCEVSVYDVDTGSLLWSGGTTTTDPQNIKDLVKQIASATMDELRAEGLLR
jgi:hypothetical protein